MVHVLTAMLESRAPLFIRVLKLVAVGLPRLDYLPPCPELHTLVVNFNPISSIHPDFAGKPVLSASCTLPCTRSGQRPTRSTPHMSRGCMRSSCAEASTALVLRHEHF